MPLNTEHFESYGYLGFKSLLPVEYSFEAIRQSLLKGNIFNKRQHFLRERIIELNIHLRTIIRVFRRQPFLISRELLLENLDDLGPCVCLRIDDKPFVDSVRERGSGESEDVSSSYVTNVDSLAERVRRDLAIWCVQKGLNEEVRAYRDRLRVDGEVGD